MSGDLKRGFDNPLDDYLKDGCPLAHLPEHYFCIFRTPSLAAAFSLKDLEEQAAELRKMHGRVVDGIPPYGVHLRQFPVAVPLPLPSAPPIDDPSLLTKAANLGKAALRVGTAIVCGEKVTVSDEEHDRRMDICRDCEFFNHERESCRHCGCNSIFKNRLATEHCPISRW